MRFLYIGILSYLVQSKFDIFDSFERLVLKSFVKTIGHSREILSEWNTLNYSSLLKVFIFIKGVELLFNTVTGSHDLSCTFQFKANQSIEKLLRILKF